MVYFILKLNAMSSSIYNYGDVLGLICDAIVIRTRPAWAGFRNWNINSNFEVKI
jgi:hypothetical protein